MTKRFSLKKVAITLLSALFVLCASFGIVSAKNANSVKADEVVAFQMLDGADLRLDAENNGLRFAATVPSDYVEGDVYQMLIVPASWIKDVEIPNGDYIAYLEATYPEQELAIAPLHPITWAEESVAGFEEGKRYFLGAITDIRYENLNREFFAIAYRTNGEVREYATFNEGQNVRSVFYIASAYAGVYEAGTDSAKIVDNFIVSAINQKAGVAEADKFNAVSYDLSIAGSDTVKIDETATYAVEGTVGGVNISSLNAIVSYSVEGNGASISADGVLSVSEEGTVTVKAFVLGQELTKTVVVEKAIKEVTIDMGNYVLNTVDVEGINFVIEGIEGAPKSVSYKLSSERELDVATLTYDAVAQTLTIPYATVKGLYGPYTTTFTITTDSAIYTVNVVFVTLAISDASQINAGSTDTVNQMQRLGGAETGASGSYYGYYVLTNDIDFGGKEVLHKEYSLWDSKGGAHIEIQGNGYALKNFVVKSILLFDGLGQDTNGAKSSFKNLGFIGTVEGGYGLFGYYMSVNLDNCYFDVKVADGKAMFGSYYGPWMGEVKNTTFVISGLNGEDVKFTSGDVNTAGYNWSGSVMFIDNSQDSVVDSKLQGAKIYDYSDNFVSVTISAGEDATIDVAGATKVLRNGKDITAKVIINENNVVIPSAETSETETYVVISDTSAKVISLEVQRTEHNAVLGYSKRNVDATAAADFSYEVNGTVVYATIDGSEVEYAEDNGVVTIESVKAISSGSKARNLVIATETDIYHIALTVADYVITSAEDYAAMNWQKAFGRAEGVKWGSGLKAVVLADLDFGGATVSFGPILNEWAGANAGFVGSLDFNGYAIHNLTFSNNLLGDNILGEATISNLRLYDYTCTDIITSWYHNSVKYGWYIEGARTKMSMGPSDAGNGYRNWFRNGIIINTNESEGVEDTNMTSGGGGDSCGNLNVQNGFDALTIQGYPNSYMIGNGKFLPADSWGQDETRCGTYKYSENVVTPAIEDGSVAVDLGFTPTAVYKDGAKLDIALSSTITIENADASATYLVVGNGAVKIIRPTIVAE